MGVLAPGCAHARPSTWPPIDISGIFPAHVSAGSPSNISLDPSEVISEVSEPYNNFSKYPPCPPENGMGEGGVHNFLGDWNPYIFVT